MKSSPIEGVRMEKEAEDRILSKRNFEKIQINKKNVSDLNKRKDIAAEQITILENRIEKFEEENINLEQKVIVVKTSNR